MKHDELRGFINIANIMMVEPQPTMLTEDVAFIEYHPEPALDENTQEELESLIFKLRSYQDSESGDYAAGVEAGMNRAADMLENLVNRLRGE